MLHQALIYLSKGFSIIPLKPKGKEPLIPWQEFQKRRATEQEIKSWFQKWPDANLGIVTGSISGIVIVDLDGLQGLETANRMKLTSSVLSLTGNGKHLWYKCPKDFNVQNAVKLYPGLDIRGEGGYIVAPGSIHENGKRYRFLTPFGVLGDAAKLPCLPMERLKISLSTELPNKQKEKGWIARSLEAMHVGNIDDTLTSILGRMRRDSWTSDDALSMLLPHALAKGATPGHLEAKIENIWNRYPSKTEGQMRLYPSNEQSLLLSPGLVIHSPTNPDSIKQFEQCNIPTLAGKSLFTGYSKLDQMLTGGLKSSRLFVVAARTGVGKTNWLIGVAKQVCESGKRVLLFSTEMPYNQIWERYIATLSDPKTFEQHQFYVCDSFAPNIEKVEEAIEMIKPDIFMFDHINHVAEDPRELGTFMQGLNYLRRKYDCAGIVSAQLNRSADWVDLKTGEKVTPRMSMIKGSGTIEQASSRVLLLSETRVTPEMTEIVGNLDKNDNGSKGLIHFGLLNNPYKMVEL